MNKSIVIVLIVMVLGLLLFNVYLFSENENLKEENKILDTKFNTRLGDIDILTYDLVTTRDSLRIILESVDTVPIIQKEFY